MKQEEVHLAGLVVSKAGRDKGRSFLIVGCEGADYLLLADGDLRKIDKPKKKKRMHVHLKPAVEEELKAKLLNGERVFDAEFRKAIARLTGD